METNKYSEIFTQLIDEIKSADDHKARLLILFKKPIFLFLVCLCGVAFLQWYKSVDTHASTSASDVGLNQTVRAATEASPHIYVDISGSVVDPQVHKVPENTRLYEVIEKSGGLNELADRPYFYRNFNLAMVLDDQDKIYVPSTTEVVSGIYQENAKLVSAYSQAGTQTRSQGSEQPSSSGKISINQASQAALETLKGVGEITASKIVAGRPYASVDDLVEKDIINQSLFDSIRDQLEL